MQLKVSSDLSELVEYDFDGYPVYIRHARLSMYNGYAALSHWHDDFEVNIVLSGRMDFNVNGEVFCLSSGEGIFVNSRQLHYGFSSDFMRGGKLEVPDCEFLCLRVNPHVLYASELFASKYVIPLFSNGNFTSSILRGEGWQKDIIENTKKIYEAREDEAAELKIQVLLSQMLLTLFSNAPKMDRDNNSFKALSFVKRMITFIQANYYRKITLKDICQDAGLSKSLACSLFKRYVGESIMQYTNHYRLSIARDLLLRSDDTIFEIAEKTGFIGASYFSEAFAKVYKKSPRAYRMEARGAN